MVFKPRTFHGELPESEKQYPVANVVELTVANRLGTAGDLDASEIAVIASDGHVRLEGTASSENEIDRVISLVRSVDGVTGIESNLRLRRSARG